MSKFFTLSFLIFFLSGCGSDSPQERDAISYSTTKGRDLHLLIFKKESKLEVWNSANENELLFTEKIQLLDFLPIGMFDLKIDAESKTARIDFPGKFYKNKNYDQIFGENIILNLAALPTVFFEKPETVFSKIIIFPNDNRSGGELEPCFACPHWMAEVYSFLDLVKKKYI